VATVWIKPISHAPKLINYALLTKEPDDPAYAKGCSLDNPLPAFQLMANLHGKGDRINAYHIRQSWSDKDSKKMRPEDFNMLGRKLVEEKFPGHLFLCVTHTETGKVHNHIVVCPWHSETGKKIVDKKMHLYDLRKISDHLCKDYGLSVIKHKDHEKSAELPDKVRKIERDRGTSWLVDLCQKADFARAYATCYDEYTAILAEMGVRARVEEKSISYFYKENTRGKRGSKLGIVYDKQGLEKAFKENDVRFAQVPGLRDDIRSALDAHAEGRSPTSETRKTLKEIPNSTYVKGQRDYKAYTKEARQGSDRSFPHQKDIASSIIPIEDLRRARLSNIPEYCRTHNITLEKNDGGKVTLHGRPHVEISDYEWTNTKNNTRGSLIELVAAHKDMTFLQAVVEITGNQRLLMLEDHFGEVVKPYQSFYIPTDRQAPPEKGKEYVEEMLAAHDLDPSLAKELLASNQVQVGDPRVQGDEDLQRANDLPDNIGDNFEYENAGNLPNLEIEKTPLNNDIASKSKPAELVDQPDQDSTPTAKDKIERIGDLIDDLAGPGSRPRSLPTNNATPSHIIRFFAKDDEGGTVEFERGTDKQWLRRNLGTFKKPLFSASKNSTKARIFMDPINFLKSFGAKAMNPKSHPVATLCLMDPSTKLIDRFILNNRTVRSVEIFFSSDSANRQVELEIFNNLKERYRGLSLNFEIGQERGLGRDRSVDLPSL